MSRTATTLPTPAGNRVRTATGRRFILVADHMDAAGVKSAHVVKRSDNLDTLRTQIRRSGRAVRFVDGSIRALHVIDRITKEVVA